MSHVKYMEEKADERSLFASLAQMIDAETADSFKQFAAPVRETALYRDVPNTEEWRKLFSDMFKAMKRRGCFKDRRLAIRFRGPRISAYNWHTLKADGTTFAVYIWRK